MVLVTVPTDAVAGTTYARFRISSAGGLGPIYWAPDGEVEDYQVVILPGPTINAFEYFDGVTAPALPAGWTMVAEQDPAMVWTTVAESSDTAPNHAFIPDIDPNSNANPDPYGLTRLTSPSVDIVGGIDQLRFRHYYRTEDQWDGGVLEISINGGARQDIIAAGGSFLAGAYTDLLNLEPNWGPLYNRWTWSGNSGGYIDTIVKLPPAAIGQSVQFHWILGVDTYSGDVGWRVDTIQLGISGELAFDFGDAPDPTYPTLSASDGAGHVFGAGVYLGAAVDADADGQPTAGATGDDTDTSGDDEDGVTFTSR